jgi:hypothetical protein
VKALFVPVEMDDEQTRASGRQVTPPLTEVRWLSFSSDREVTLMIL